jgi:Rod binding domain-containing protein
MNIEPTSARLTPALQPERKAAGQSFQDALAQASSTQPSKIADAAKQFEALMLGQILKAARESSDGGWLGTGEDHSGELALDMAEQQFAQAMSARGGLGLAKMVTAGIERGAAKAATSGSPAAAPATPSSTDSQQ